MVDSFKLAVISRNKEEKYDLKSFIPAVVYGAGLESKSLLVKRDEFEKIFKLAGETSLIELLIDKAPAIKVVIKDCQMHNVKRQIIHVEFHQVNLTKKITAEIPLHFIGESPAVHTLGGVLFKGFNELKVECLPGDLIHAIEINLSELKQLGDTIKIKDLKLPKGIEATHDGEEIVISVDEARRVEEVKPAETTPATATTETPKTEAPKAGEKKAEEKK